MAWFTVDYCHSWNNALLEISSAGCVIFQDASKETDAGKPEAGPPEGVKMTCEHHQLKWFQ
jgi:hypothetical protein